MLVLKLFDLVYTFGFPLPSRCCALLQGIFPTQGFTQASCISDTAGTFFASAIWEARNKGYMFSISVEFLYTLRSLGIYTELRSICFQITEFYFLNSLTK